jgi:DNA-binding transcriptional regulator YiaG
VTLAWHAIDAMDPLDAALTRARRRRLPDPAIRRLLREQAGLSQDELAEALGVSRPTVTRWELGQRTPRGDLAERYAAALDLLAGVRQ